MLIRQLLLNGIIAGSTYALVALGFSLIYSVCRFFHFAHAGVIACGAYFAWTCISVWSFPPAVAVAVAVLGSAAVGAASYVGVYYPLLRRQAGQLEVLLASLGLYVVTQNLLSLIFSDRLRSLESGDVQIGIQIVGARITPIQTEIVITNLILFGIIGYIHSRTRVGSIVRAVASDPELASIRGLDQRRVTTIVFAVGSALGGIAGILLAYEGTLSPTMGFEALVMGVIASILGGMGTMSGALVGGFGIAFIQVLAAWELPTKWQQTIVFLVVLIILLLRPSGIMNQRWWRGI